MQCYIYKSLRKQQLYLYLRKMDDFSRVPEDLLANLGKLEFILEIELTPNKRLAKEDPAKVLACLQEKGYFIQWPPIGMRAPATLQ